MNSLGLTQEFLRTYLGITMNYSELLCIIRITTDYLDFLRITMIY